MPKLPHTLLAASLACARLAAAAEPAADARYQELAARIQALEAESQKLRDQAAQALEAAQAARAELDRLRAEKQEAAVAAVSAAPQAAPAASGGNAFNPAISVILNGTYAHHSLDPDDYVL